MCERRKGFTLIEMLVALSILALASAVAVLGFGQLVDSADRSDKELQRVRELAITSGVPQAASVESQGVSVLFLPDGRAVGGGFDPLTGERIER